MVLKNIEIDWEIHKLIEQERQGFDEPPYVALRRLLSLPESNEACGSEIEQLDDGLPWSEDGVVIPHGSLAKMEYDYGRQVYEGEFRNGMLVVNGQQYETLSAAASNLATTRAGKKPQLNGWVYWQVKLRGEDDWKRLGELRSANRNK